MITPPSSSPSLTRSLPSRHMFVVGGEHTVDTPKRSAACSTSSPLSSLSTSSFFLPPQSSSSTSCTLTTLTCSTSTSTSPTDFARCVLVSSQRRRPRPRPRPRLPLLLDVRSSPRTSGPYPIPPDSDSSALTTTTTIAGAFASAASAAARSRPMLSPHCSHSHRSSLVVALLLAFLHLFFLSLTSPAFVCLADLLPEPSGPASSSYVPSSTTSITTIPRSSSSSTGAASSSSSSSSSTASYNFDTSSTDLSTLVIVLISGAGLLVFLFLLYLAISCHYRLMRRLTHTRNSAAATAAAAAAVSTNAAAMSIAVRKSKHIDTDMFDSREDREEAAKAAGRAGAAGFAGPADIVLYDQSQGLEVVSCDASHHPHATAIGRSKAPYRIPPSPPSRSSSRLRPAFIIAGSAGVNPDAVAAAAAAPAGKPSTTITPAQALQYGPARYHTASIAADRRLPPTPPPPHAHAAVEGERESILAPPVADARDVVVTIGEAGHATDDAPPASVEGLARTASAPHASSSHLEGHSSSATTGEPGSATTATGTPSRTRGLSAPKTPGGVSDPALTALPPADSRSAELPLSPMSVHHFVPYATYAPARHPMFPPAFSSTHQHHHHHPSNTSSSLSSAAATPAQPSSSIMRTPRMHPAGAAELHASYARASPSVNVTTPTFTAATPSSFLQASANSTYRSAAPLPPPTPVPTSASASASASTSPVLMPAPDAAAVPLMHAVAAPAVPAAPTATVDPMATPATATTTTINYELAAALAAALRVSSLQQTDPTVALLAAQALYATYGPAAIAMFQHLAPLAIAADAADAANAAIAANAADASAGYTDDDDLQTDPHASETALDGEFDATTPIAPTSQHDAAAADAAHAVGAVSHHPFARSNASSPRSTSSPTSMTSLLSSSVSASSSSFSLSHRDEMAVPIVTVPASFAPASFAPASAVVAPSVPTTLAAAAGGHSSSPLGALSSVPPSLPTVPEDSLSSALLDDESSVFASRATAATAMSALADAEGADVSGGRVASASVAHTPSAICMMRFADLALHAVDVGEDAEDVSDADAHADASIHARS